MNLHSDVGLVLEGGGFRGMYTAGVLDVFFKEKIFFDYIIGVSAGAAYGVSYVAGQYERNLKVNKYVSDKRYFSFGNFVKMGSFFNWDFIYKEIPTKLIPFDYESFSKSPTRMRVGVTNCTTGTAEYKDLDASSPESFRDLLTATSSLPFISKMCKIDDQYYMDGGIADSIPVKQAIKDGKKRLVVVLTRDSEYRKEQMKFGTLLKLAYRKYPNMTQALLDRADTYNRTLEELAVLEKEGRAFVIRPSEPIAVARLENNPDNLERVYHSSIQEMEEVIPKLKDWLNQDNQECILLPD
ncbi:MAG: patatin family protein [Bacteroidota bacterium]|nr:patatin family protein [Bacteroidota bacterium]